MAQIAFGVAGAVVGSFFGNPALGWAIGSAVGGLLFPQSGPDINQSVEGQRLSDLQVSGSTYGGTIPICYGTQRLAGNLIWALPIEEEKIVDTQSQEVGGKGGGGSTQTVTTTTYKYYASFAIAFGEGVASNVIRIWADGKLVYDRSDPGERALDPDNPNAADEAPLDEDIFKTSGPDANMVFYPGTATQEPSPLIAATHGDLTPAHRDLVYITFERVPLTNFGNRIPNITAEIVFKGRGVNITIPPEPAVNTHMDYQTSTSGGTFPNATTDYARKHLYVSNGSGWIRKYNMESGQLLAEVDTSLDPKVQSYNYSIQKICIHPVTGDVYVGWDDADRVDGIARLDSTTLTVLDITTIAVSGDYRALASAAYMIPTTVSTNFGPVHYVVYGAGQRTSLLRGMHCHIIKASSLSPDLDTPVFTINTVFLGLPNVYGGASGIGGAMTQVAAPTLGALDIFVANGVMNVITAGEGTRTTQWGVTYHRFYTATQQSQQITYAYSIDALYAAFPTELAWLADTNYSQIRNNDGMFYDYSDDTVILNAEIVYVGDSSQNRTVHFKMDPRSGEFIWAIDDQGEYAMPRLPRFDGTNGQSIVNGSIYLPENIPSLPSGKGVYIWDTSVPEVVGVRELVGDTFPTISTEAGNPINNVDGTYTFNSNYPWSTVGAADTGDGTASSIFRHGVISTSGVAVQDIINDVSDRVGLDPNLFTVTVPDTVASFVISQVTAARNPLTTLSAMFNFDIIESDFGLKAVSRGANPSLTIDADDLVEANGKSPYEVTRIPDVELPMEVSIAYASYNLDYQQNTAHSKRVQNPAPSGYSQNKLALSVAMTIDDNEAIRQAEKLLYSAWAERTSYSYQLPHKYLALEPTDVITLQDTQFPALYEQRLSQTSLGADFQIETAGISTVPAAYASTATSQPNLGFRPGSLPSANLTQYFVLDTPLLRDVDATNRVFDTVYHAAGGYDIGVWLGAGYFESLDNSQYTQLGQLGVETTWGVALTALPDTDSPFTPDETTTIRVSLVNGELFGATDTDLFSSTANALAFIKADAEIEIVQFRDVTQISDKVYDISYLLRGRRGTDYAANGHTTSEKVVLLSAGIEKTNIALADLGVTRYYRALGIGLGIDQAVSRVLAPSGKSLKPYTVADITATEDGSSNIDFTWKRRTRLYGQLADGTGNVPLNEDTEAYEIDIYNAAGDTILRTVTGLISPAYEYLNADIITDFGSVPTNINVIIYQISAQVGRGFGVLTNVEVS